MGRKCGELVPIGEVVSGMDDVPGIPADSPQARHSFTVADQWTGVGFGQRREPRPGVHARSNKDNVDNVQMCPYPLT